MSFITKTMRFIKCANNECEFEFKINYIFEESSAKDTYQQTCSDCGYENNIKVVRDASNSVIDVQTTIGNRVLTPCYVLLSYHKDSELFFLVLESNLYNLDASYYFNEHTCPSNWMRGDVVALLDASINDSDPHGIFKFVAAKPKDEIDKKYQIDHETIEHDWFDIFKEEIDLQKGIIENVEVVVNKPISLENLSNISHT